MTETPAIDPREERACAALCLALVIPFVLFVLAAGRVSLFEYGRLSAAFLGIALAMLIGAFVCFALVELARQGRASRWRDSPRRVVAAALTRRWREDRFMTLAWPMLLFLLLLPAFNAFKQRLLPQAGFAWDPELAALDRALFGGDPGLLLHQLIGSPLTTRAFDALYHGWFVPTMLGLCVVGLCAGTRTRAQYMLSYAAVWIVLGAVLAYALPAAGPAFYAVLVDPAGAAPFAAVHDRLVATGGSERFLTSLGNQAYLLRNLDAPVLVVGGGISAIPSVHNAMATLFALASFRVDRRLGLAMTLFAVTIWIASVYLNWHYAVDGIFGAGGAVALWCLAGNVVDRVVAAPKARPEPVASPA